MYNLWQLISGEDSCLINSIVVGKFSVKTHFNIAVFKLRYLVFLLFVCNSIVSINCWKNIFLDVFQSHQFMNYKDEDLQTDNFERMVNTFTVYHNTHVFNHRVYV